MKHIDPRTVSTAALAYLGDSVFELFVRRRLVSEGYSSSKNLNTKSRGFVTATAQAAAMERLQAHLTEQEAAVFRRGRNYTHVTAPKSATNREYHIATGLEALFGYLYITGAEARAAELFELAFQTEDKDKKDEDSL